MGLFGFVKKKVEEKTIKLEEVEDWLDKYVETKQVGESLSVIKRELGSKVKRLEELLSALENSALANSKILPERAISVMDGNRRSYIQKIRNFIVKLNFPDKYDDAKNFLETMSEELEELAKDTQKNFFILKEFMEDQVRPIAIKLSELDKLIANAREQLDKTALDKVKQIKNHVKKFYSTEQQIYLLKKQVDEIEKFKLELYDKRSKIDDKLRSIKEGKGYEELIALEKKEELLKTSIKKLEEKVLAIFSDIEPVMKKYYSKKKDKIVKSYISNPLKALLEDDDFLIVRLSKGMLKEKELLNIKDSLKERAVKRLEDLELKVLKEIKNSVNDSRQELEDLTKRLKNHSVRLNIKEQEGWLQTLDKDVLEEDKKIENIGFELERLNLGLIMQKIRQHLKELDNNIELQK